MSYFHIVVIFNDYYTLIVAFLMKQIQNRYRNRGFTNTLQRAQTISPITLFPLQNNGFKGFA